MVAEVCEVFADEGELAEVIPALDKAIMNVNGWTGAQVL